MHDLINIMTSVSELSMVFGMFGILIVISIGLWSLVMRIFGHLDHWQAKAITQWLLTMLKISLVVTGYSGTLFLIFYLLF